MHPFLFVCWGQALRSKDEALRCAERESRAKNLEIAALKGDLAGEQRVRAAVAGKLEKACSERDEVGRCVGTRVEVPVFTKFLYLALSK